MIPHRQDNTVISNSNAGKKFTLSASAEAFAILSSGIYENKIRAIVREISCNAFDAHVAAGKADVPFEVTLPTSFAPTFTVRDFGIGLSHDDVMNLYSTYFASTKQETNELIGAKGLGSKSPFSYTDQFTVISIFEGEKSTYNAYVGEDGTPTITRLSKVKTDESNGVTVSMGVEPSDCREFASEARNVLRWFEKTPVIHGTDVEINSVVPVEADDFFSVDSTNYFSTNAYAWMGNVAYPATEEFNRILSESDENTRFVRTMLSGRDIVIRFNLGELDTAASREALSFDPETKKNFDAKVAKIITNIKKTVQDEIDAVDSIRDIATTGYDNLIRAKMVKYNGKPLTDYEVRFRHGRLMNEDKKKKLDDGTVDNFSDFDAEEFHYAFTPRRVVRTTTQHSHTFAPWMDKIKVLVKDAKKHARHNLQEMFDHSTGNQHVFMVEPEHLQSFKDTFADFVVEVEYLSKRIEDGHTPPKKARGSYGPGMKVAFFDSDGGESIDKLNMGEIKDKIDELKADGKEVYVWGQGFNENPGVDKGMTFTVAKFFKVPVALVRITESKAEKLIEDGVCKDIKEVKHVIHDDYIEAHNQQESAINQLKDSFRGFYRTLLFDKIAGEFTDLAKQIPALAPFKDEKYDKLNLTRESHAMPLRWMMGDRLKESNLGYMEIRRISADVEEAVEKRYPVLERLGAYTDHRAVSEIIKMTDELNELRNQVAKDEAA